MTISPALLKRLSALEVSPEVMREMLAILADAMAAEEERLAKQRDRKARQRQRLSRDRHGTEDDVTGQSRGHTPPPKESSPQTPFKEITPTPVFASRTPRAREDTTDFDAFWAAYPHKVGKADARLKFPKALEKAALPELLAGLQRYIAEKPPDRSWCNPATWLHQERWGDQPAPVTNGHARPNGTGPPRQKSVITLAAEGLRRRGLIPEKGMEDEQFTGPSLDLSTTKTSDA